MSANVVWFPDKPRKAKDLGFRCPSDALEAFRDAFAAEPPYSLNENNLPTLRGMMAGKQDTEKKAYGKLIEAIEKVGAVVVEWEY